jgi:hypothetical protein
VVEEKMTAKTSLVALSVFAALSMTAPGIASAATPEEQRLTELRNTISNLLQVLVERGVVTREQAQGMVIAAQEKAAADAAAEVAARAEQEKAEAGAIRVPYVPQIVRDQIRNEVLAELTPAVTKEVVAEAASQETLRSALPDWVQRMRWFGDVRVRGQGDLFSSDNATGAYVDFLTVNDRGGIGRAGVAALSNTEEDRQRLRLRARLGAEVELGYGWTTAMRVSTGNLRDPVSTNQTLGNTAARYQLGVEQAYVRWTGQSDTARQTMTGSFGRIPNPWVSTDLIWDQDLVFEGVAANYRYSIARDDLYSRNVFATAGAFPLQEVELSTKDKWLYGGQTGFEWQTSGGHRLRAAAAYYAFVNISGKRNLPDSSLLDFTAPGYLQRGNTLFDIRNDTDPATNLFALAADYRIVDVTAAADLRLSALHRLSFTASAVKNIGYDRAKVLARTGFDVEPRTRGYQGEIGLGYGRMNVAGAWRATVGYRYLQRDAVLDAFTDSDFRLGGTDVKGFTVGAEYAMNPRVLMRMRYLSGNEIDGPPLGIDVLQLDLTAQF